MTRLKPHVSRITHHVLRITHYASSLAHHDLTLVVAVALVARLLAIIALRVGGYVAETGPDSAYHFQLGRLSASGAYPFIDYWTEYPPFFPWLTVLAHKMSTLMPSWIDQRFWFNLSLHGLIAPFEAGNVVLVYALSRKASGAPDALKSAWLYALLFAPMFVVLGWFESIALFAVLFALWLILEDRPIPAGVAIGLGMLVKPYVALIGAVGLIHLSTWCRVGLLVASAALAYLAGLSPFLIASPEMVKAHFTTLLTLPGWSSPYALIDGVIKHADPQLAERFDAALAASSIAPSQVPWAAVTLAFAVVYGLVLFRAYRQQHSRAAVGLAGFSFVMYLLWSKGYSPQWSLYLIAFLCILMPNLRGMLMLIALELLYVIEWPVAFILLQADPGYLTALVAVRTLVTIGLGVLFTALIFVKSDQAWSRLRKGSIAGSLAALAAVIALAAGALPVYRAQRYRIEPMREAVDLIQSSSAPDGAGVLFDRVDTYERLASFLAGWPKLAALRLGSAADAWSEAEILSFAEGRAELWYVLDYGATARRNIGEDIDRYLSDSLCIVSRQFAGAARVARYANAKPGTDLRVSADFEKGIALAGARINNTSIGQDDPICVELVWTADATPSTDYTVFVHLLDAAGNLVAQSDIQPGSGYTPTTTWTPHQPILDRHGLIPPAGLAPGTYRLTAGMYDLEGVRLPTGDGADSAMLGEIVAGD
ncbi:MAG TPA: glycosyltransferase family 87 protein [Anaerolineae bacterium]|nr:glycosyltransferase family 87 protein [Anaerolineae bacterium]